MSESSTEPDVGISDDKLPEDLVPGDDNPLADGLPDGESPGDLLADGKTADQSEGEDAVAEAEDPA